MTENVNETVDESVEVVADEVEQTLDLTASLTADLQRLQAEYANYRKRVERDRAQGRIAGTRRDTDLPPLSWAVAAVMHNASRTKKPETAVADLLSPFLQMLQLGVIGDCLV